MVGNSGSKINDVEHAIQDPQDTFRTHTSHLSDTSSLNSQLPCTGPERSINPDTHFSRTSTERGYMEYTRSISPRGSQQREQPAPSIASRQGTRRSSDASSRQDPPSSSSSNNSRRTTRELGDVYDSYWGNHSSQSQQLPLGVKGGQSGNQGKEARRQNSLSVDIPTIAEVPTPVASPAGRENVGLAM